MAEVPVLYRGVLYLRFLCMELALCHSSGASNFEVGPRFLENLWSPGLIDLGVLFSYCHVIANNGNMSDICVSCLHSLCFNPRMPVVIQTSNARLPWYVRLQYSLRYHKLSGTAFSLFWSISLLGFQRLTDVWMYVLSELKSRWVESGTGDIASSTTWFQADSLLRVQIIGLKKITAYGVDGPDTSVLCIFTVTSKLKQY